MSIVEDSVFLGAVVVWSVGTALLVQKAALGFLLDVLASAVAIDSSRHVREADSQRVVGTEEKRLDGLR